MRTPSGQRPHARAASGERGGRIRSLDLESEPNENRHETGTALQRWLALKCTSEAFFLFYATSSALRTAGAIPLMAMTAGRNVSLRSVNQ